MVGFGRLGKMIGDEALVSAASYPTLRKMREGWGTLS
jgi:hypothetical protein